MTIELRRENPPLEFTDEQRQMIRDTFASGATDGEFAVLMEIARARRLNPLLKQIHFVSRWDSEKKRPVWSNQVSIDGLRAIAERTGLYHGQDEPEFVYDNEGNLRCAKVRVWRRDWPRPAVGVAYYSEYVQTARDRNTQEERPTRFWARMPHVMLEKCAAARALRTAFPEDMSGLYVPEEMDQAENDANTRDAYGPHEEVKGTPPSVLVQYTKDLAKCTSLAEVAALYHAVIKPLGTSQPAVRDAAWAASKKHLATTHTATVKEFRAALEALASKPAELSAPVEPATPQETAAIDTTIDAMQVVARTLVDTAKAREVSPVYTEPEKPLEDAVKEHLAERGTTPENTPHVAPKEHLAGQGSTAETHDVRLIPYENDLDELVARTTITVEDVAKVWCKHKETIAKCAVGTRRVAWGWAVSIVKRTLDVTDEAAADALRAAVAAHEPPDGTTPTKQRKPRAPKVDVQGDVAQTDTGDTQAMSMADRRDYTDRADGDAWRAHLAGKREMAPCESLHKRRKEFVSAGVWTDRRNATIARIESIHALDERTATEWVDKYLERRASEGKAA